MCVGISFKREVVIGDQWQIVSCIDVWYRFVIGRMRITNKFKKHRTVPSVMGNDCSRIVGKSQWQWLKL